MAKKLKPHQITMLRVRGLDPKNYEVVKDTYTSLYLRDLRTGKIMVLYKRS